jgi:hypothetical protein
MHILSGGLVQLIHVKWRLKRTTHFIDSAIEIDQFSWQLISTESHIAGIDNSNLKREVNSRKFIHY